tara:strand:+ start:123 stop:1310 length:1188 start_codon:yes stop_codon:yes gene_type:complete
LILYKAIKNITFAALTIAVVTITGCSTSHNRPAEHLLYSATFSLDDSTSVVVLAENAEGGIVVKNGAERVFLESHSEGVYSVPVFGGSWIGEWGENIWSGVWIDSLREVDYRVKLEIRPLVEIKPVEVGAEMKLSIWDTSIGRLKLSQKRDSVWATVMTPTGDYRYQAGKIDTVTQKFILGNFDGVHLFYFEGIISGDSITDGVFKSGTHYATKWSGVKAESEEVGWLSKQDWGRGEVVKFEGVGSDGNIEVWSNERFASSGFKLLVVDVMGTWCPNCMDEIILLKELSLEYPEMLVVSMAFERSKGDAALSRIARFKESLEIPWAVLYGGNASKSEADSLLSFMGGIKSFPTTAFIPLEGEPVIHTGFSGPATGKSYEEEVAFFRKTIESLLGY